MKRAYKAGALGVVLIAGWWFAWASPAAQTRRAVSARRDSIAAFAALERAIDSAFTTVRSAETRYHDKHGKWPYTREQLVEVGLDARRLEETTDAETRRFGYRALQFHSSARIPKRLRMKEYQESLTVVTIGSPVERMSYSTSLPIASQMYTCQQRPGTTLRCKWGY